VSFTEKEQEFYPKKKEKEETQPCAAVAVATAATSAVVVAASELTEESPAADNNDNDEDDPIVTKEPVAEDSPKPESIFDAFKVYSIEKKPKKMKPTAAYRKILAEMLDEDDESGNDDVDDDVSASVAADAGRGDGDVMSKDVASELSSMDDTDMAFGVPLVVRKTLDKIEEPTVVVDEEDDEGEEKYEYEEEEVDLGSLSLSDAFKVFTVKKGDKKKRLINRKTPIGTLSYWNPIPRRSPLPNQAWMPFVITSITRTSMCKTPLKHTRWNEMNRRHHRHQRRRNRKSSPPHPCKRKRNRRMPKSPSLRQNPDRQRQRRKSIPPFKHLKRNPT